MRILAMLLMLAIPVFGQFDKDPFSAGAKLEPAAGGKTRLVVDFNVPKGLYLYQSAVKVSADGLKLTAENEPKTKKKLDASTGKEMLVYEENFNLSYLIPKDTVYPLKVKVEYQGCKDEVCFMPQSKVFEVSPSGAESAAASDVKKGGEPAGDSKAILGEFKIIGSDVGYKSSKDMLAFIDRVESGKGMEENPLRRMLSKHGAVVMIIFILLGGLALNLTPCVLPMIPINIAIIGAGTQAGSRSRGFTLGAVYGLGIALVYGLLGVVVVLTGSQFGTLNSSPWFNLGIAVLFAVLALAMFDVFNIDFSKYQKGGSAKKHGPFVTAFVFGGVAALLAGACVAPVLIWVLVFSTEIYQRGSSAGLLLPFVLGLGMALPWPFAGAGLSFLPKPGKWMENIKRVFGVIILLAAAYYGWLFVKLVRVKPVEAAPAAVESKAVWYRSFDEALSAARESGKPIFVDVWSTWCKSCDAMERTTLKDPEVLARLDKYVLLKFQAEDPTDPEIKKVLDALGVLGQPFLVFLQTDKGSNDEN